ncbi:MAG TPA: glutathione S-transferase family protein [Rhizomicrobium sp.]|jgi:glutathione S-transferase|nr:glutathione S-transferase family protein [Rhizomicrobium sp.]
MPILHNMPMSGNCYKVRLLAHRLGIPLTLRDYGLHDGETRKTPFLSKNPNGRVPMLEFDDGRCLAESNAILFYLSEGTKYQPADKWARAEMMQWMFFEQYSHEPYVAVLRYLLTYATPEARAARQANEADLRKRGDAALGVMQTHLSKHAWFAGEDYSIADIALYGYTHCAGEGGFDLAAYPAVSAWIKRVASQPGHIPL